MNVYSYDASGNRTSTYWETGIIKYLNTEYGINVPNTDAAASQKVTSADGKSEIILNYNSILSNGERIFTGFSHDV